MTISELIQKLQMIEAEYGNIAISSASSMSPKEGYGERIHVENKRIYSMTIVID